MNKITETRREHKVYTEMKQANCKHCPVGRWQYTYKSDKGIISLIKLPEYLMNTKTQYEIYCLKGNLFEDVERFDTMKEARRRIKELLE